MSVEFISYSGKYPNLCSGTLVCKINDITTKFGFKAYGLSSEEREKTHTYPRFWTSGGAAGVNRQTYDSFCTSGPWELSYDKEEYPDYINDCMDDLIDMFNNFVPKGCCGGCI